MILKIIYPSLNGPFNWECELLKFPWILSKQRNRWMYVRLKQKGQGELVTTTFGMGPTAGRHVGHDVAPVYTRSPVERNGDHGDQRVSSLHHWPMTFQWAPRLTFSKQHDTFDPPNHFLIPVFSFFTIRSLTFNAFLIPSTYTADHAWDHHHDWCIQSSRFVKAHLNGIANLGTIYRVAQRELNNQIELWTNQFLYNIFF